MPYKAGKIGTNSANPSETSDAWELSFSSTAWFRHHKRKPRKSTYMATKPTSSFFNALIQTHHITSRKKVARLRTAADHHARYVVIRYGGSPGLMYVEGDEEGVTAWVGAVKRLRYKDFQLLRKVGRVEGEVKGDEEHRAKGFVEVESVQEFAGRMEELGVLRWWRRAMGFDSD